MNGKFRIIKKIILKLEKTMEKLDFFKNINIILRSTKHNL